jgi:glyoxylase-like metal-dependent hydrolase (beta-lactamase superfamily II)
VRGFGKHVTGVYITHGHQDHWIGLGRLQEHFPDARGVATPEVVERARFEATNPGLPAYWIASLDAIAVLDPRIVVAGHRSVGVPDLSESIGASQQYLRDFSRIVNEGGGVQDVVSAMLKLHGDRDNPRTLWHSARVAVAKRDS